MISLAYINGTQDVELTELLTESFMDLTQPLVDTFNEAMNEYEKSVALYEAEMFVMEAVDDEKKKKFESNNQNFIAKIGQFIIDLYNKFMEFANKLSASLKEKLAGEKKKDIDEVAYLCKKNPEVAEQVKNAINSGNLTIKNVKDYKELAETYDEIMKDTSSGPEALKNKWKKACDKANEHKGTIFAIAATAAAITAIAKFGPEVMKSNSDMRHAVKDKNQKITEAYRDLEKKMQTMTVDPKGVVTGGGDIAKSKGVFTTKLMIYRQMMGKYSEAMQQNETALGKFTSLMARFADKVTDTVTKGQSSANFHARMKENISEMDRQKAARAASNTINNIKKIKGKK